MKNLFLVISAAIPALIYSQTNVGIGTTTPKAFLAIHGNSFLGTPDGAQLLLMEEEDDFARLRLTNNLHSVSNNKYWDIAGRISSGVAGANDRLNIYLNGYGDIMTLNGQGNMGIGTAVPGARVHINHPTGLPLIVQGTSGMYVPFLEGSSYRGYIGSFAGNAQDVDFGTGAGNETGKVHLTIQANPQLTIRENGFVGIGTTNPLWPLDVNGAMRINGRLVVNGTGGTSGQVLTSGGGTNTPSWETLSSAYDNNIRFSFTCSEPNNTSGNMSIGTRYNTNTSAVSVSGTIITFNTTGIYHFEVAISGRIDYGSPLGYDPSFGINLYLSGGVGPGNNPVADTRLFKNGNLNRYTGMATASTDMYITAGQTMVVSFSYSNTPGGFTEIDSFGYLRGYLISP